MHMSWHASVMYVHFVIYVVSGAEGQEEGAFEVQEGH